MLFRILDNEELARAQGFPPNYKFQGSDKDVTKQIGNAVPPGLSRTLFLANWTQKNDISQFAEDIEKLNQSWQKDWESTWEEGKNTAQSAA